MLTSEIKKTLGDVLIELISKIQENRKNLTQEQIDKFFSRDKRLFMGK